MKRHASMMSVQVFASNTDTCSSCSALASQSRSRGMSAGAADIRCDHLPAPSHTLAMPPWSCSCGRTVNEAWQTIAFDLIRASEVVGFVSSQGQSLQLKPSLAESGHAWQLVCATAAANNIYNTRLLYQQPYMSSSINRHAAGP